MGVSLQKEANHVYTTQLTQNAMNIESSARPRQHLRLWLCNSLIFVVSEESQPFTHQNNIHGGGAVRIMEVFITTQQILAVLVIGEGNFRSLQNHRLANTHDEENYPPLLTYSVNEDNLTVLRGLPRFRSLTLHTQNRLHPLQLCIALGHLSSLNLSSAPLSPSSFHSILRELTSIIVGDFAITFQRPPIFSPPMAVLRMPSLRGLRLSLRNPTRDPRIFAALWLENLQDIALLSSDYEDGRGFELGLFIPFLSHSCLTLETVQLHEVPAPGQSGINWDILQSQRPTPLHETDNFLRRCTNLHTLALPTGVFLHRSSLVLISHGELLQSLTSLDLSHDNGSFVLHAIIRRNETARDNPRDNHSFFRTGITSISELSLSVLDDMEEEVRIEMARWVMNRNSACQEVNLTIRKLE